MSEPRFELDDPDLPEWVEDAAITSGNYPYDKRMGSKHYKRKLRALQIELVKLQHHLQDSGERVAVVFEGRDAAGKGGTISRYLRNLNHRHNRVVALDKPTDREQSQWYFQRYVPTLPAGGEQVLFDRSWYNRAVVEPVMGFCTAAQTANFLEETPKFERMLTDDGVQLFKIWLNIGRETQLKRFHDRRHDPLKVWKLSPVDLKALEKWDDYTAARNVMFETTDTDFAPWTVIRANDKRRARLAAIQVVLSKLDYPGRDGDLVEKIDDSIVSPSRHFMSHCSDSE